jgi:hypothetical protein
LRLHTEELYLIVASLSLLGLDRRAHATLNSHISRIFRLGLAGLLAFHVCVFLLSWVPYIPSHIISPRLDEAIGDAM